MKGAGKMTRQERQAKANIIRWMQSNMKSLDDAYGRYSTKKAKAWEYCEDLCESRDGKNLKVISKNTNFFTAGFEFEADGKRKFMYITASNDTIVDFDEEA